MSIALSIFVLILCVWLFCVRLQNLRLRRRVKELEEFSRTIKGLESEMARIVRVLERHWMAEASHGRFSRGRLGGGSVLE